MTNYRRGSSSISETPYTRRRNPTSTDFYKRILVIASVLFFISAVIIGATRLFELEDAEYDYPRRYPYRVGDIFSTSNLPMSYGNYGRPSLDDLTLIAQIPDHLLPTAQNDRRLIFIGDMHGMLEEFENLLEEVKYNKDTDHIVTSGDMVNKGPDTPGLISRLMELEISAVRGNHEDKMLLAKAHADDQVGAMKVLGGPPLEESTGVAEVLAVARSLTYKQLTWLSELPVILEIDPLSIYVVHAGLVPGLRIKKQDPWAVMNMRTLAYPKKGSREMMNQNLVSSETATATGEESAVATSKAEEEKEEEEEEEEEDDDDPNSIFLHKSFKAENVVAVPLDDRRGVKWAGEWNKYQLELKPQHRKTVIYGHDAKEGYQVANYTYGLDSGCVKGGNLTAMVVQVDKNGGLKTHKNHVPCRKII